jgi:hypothetical protein
MSKKESVYKTGSVTITVHYGYDAHSITFSGRTYDRVRSGKPTTIKGQGFYWDEDRDQDFWYFNTIEPGSIGVFTEGGGEIYSGRLDDGGVEVGREERGSANLSQC